MRDLLEAERRAPRVLAPEGRRDRAAVRRQLATWEAAVAADPEGAFAFDDAGFATLVVGDERVAAGRFTTPTLDELRRRATAVTGPRAEANAPPGLRLSALRGTGPLSDIGALQALLPAGTLFQAASQFNCLESPGDYLVPVTDYLDDNTQGPRASVSAAAGTFLRHYRAPGPGGRFVQSDARQLDLLADAIPPGVAAVRHGYLRPATITDPPALAAALAESTSRIRVGVHEGVTVSFGANWGGPVPDPSRRIHQVFTSTVALGGYGGVGAHPEAFRQLQRTLLAAAYRGTLLAAACLGAPRAVLTLIGGGVFGNDLELIWAAVVAACAEVRDLGADLEVWVNLRDAGGEGLHRQIEADTRASGGEILSV